jgi:hypothetical protein
LKIKFEIKFIPAPDQLEYLDVFLEGRLEILFDDAVFFRDDEILLVEFGLSLYKWLVLNRTNKGTDFVYESVDHDEPILIFNHSKEGFYNVNSIWQLSQINRPVPFSEIENEADRFLEELDTMLQSKCSVSLQRFLPERAN